MLNRADRAKLAKETVKITVPHILNNNSRAQEGTRNSELVQYVLNRDSLRLVDTSIGNAKAAIPPTPPSNTGVGPSTSPKIRVIQSDTYDAVKLLLENSNSRVGCLNMASSYSPGGGFTNGSLAQEESLCMRSTLYHSLKSSFYRLPELCAVYSPDVAVFRDFDLRDLPKSEWYFTDVISVAALKQPELKWNVDRTRLTYEYPQDRDLMVEKIRLIFQVMAKKGIKRVVAGALGCGAYGNPPEEVASLFRKVILGDKKRHGVKCVDEIVFAIFDDGPNLKAFKEAFADVAE
jgi:uncharacterized protein (TIGR02452 family)